MSAHAISLLILAGFAAGILSGLVGVGGGIIIVPALVLLLGFSDKEAQGTSLSVLILLIGIFAIGEAYQQGRIRISYAIIVALAFVIGGYLGNKLSISFNEQKLKKVFAVTMMLLSIRMLFFERSKDEIPPPAQTATAKLNANRQ